MPMTPVVDAPTARPSGAALADLELALSGVRLPFVRLGGRVSDSGPAEDDVVEVAADDALAAEAERAGVVVLLDTENTPVAVLEDAHPGPGAVRGRLRPRTRGESHSFPALRRPVSPDYRRVVVAGRPPLRSEVAELSAGSLVLVPVARATPDGLPPSVLVRAVQAAVGNVADVAAAPLWWRDETTDAAVAVAVAAAYGAAAPEVWPPGARDPDSTWAEALRALQDDCPMPEAVPIEVASVLRRWRPERSRRGLVVLFTGLSGSGKSTLARALARHIDERGDRVATLLDGDVVRRLLSSGLGFDRASRETNVRRIGFVAAQIARHGGIAICAPIAPYAGTRAEVRAMIEEVGDFLLVHVSTPLAECERRDLKGLYARARAGLVTEFTGISDPYDEPVDADLQIDTSQLSREEALAIVVKRLRSGGWLPS